MDRKTLREALKLDILALDVACLEQASLFEEMGKDWADAIAERDRLKERIQSKKAEIDEKIRKDPESYGWTRDLDKVTETWINTKILQSEEVVALTDELIEKQHQVNVFSVGKDSLDHRSNALRYLTELYKGNYFSSMSRKYGALSNNTSDDSIGRSQDEQGSKMLGNPRVQKLVNTVLKKRGAENGEHS